LALELELSHPGKTPEQTTGRIVLQLIKGGRSFECHIDLAKQTAQMRIPGLDEYHPQAVLNLRGADKHRLLLANVDENLLLWVDDQLVQFDDSTMYPSLGNYAPTKEDLSPAAIGVEDATVRVDHLHVLRDIYYIADHMDTSRRGPAGEIGAAREVFPLGKDQFLMLGDNSPRSLDSRLWGIEDLNGNREYYVRRDLLLGKAIFICWPHALVPDWAVSLQAPDWAVLRPFRGYQLDVPFYPNFARMSLVQ
jgi:signal peptidase I